MSADGVTALLVPVEDLAALMQTDEGAARLRGAGAAGSRAAESCGEDEGSMFGSLRRGRLGDDGGGGHETRDPEAQRDAETEEKNDEENVGEAGAIHIR